MAKRNRRQEWSEIIPFEPSFERIQHLHGRRFDDKFDPQGLNPRAFKARNRTQAVTMRTIQEHTLTFLIGPAGTAKTFLAVAHAIHQLADGKISRIVAARPAVEAGDSIGYLKGGLLEKMGPYVRPMLDCLGWFVGDQEVQRMQEAGVLEITSMTYLRGRTFTDAVLILDEMQNATVEQLKLGLTRAGDNCQLLVTGDPFQCDLPDKQASALLDLDRFRGRPGIGFAEFGLTDVVRSPIVSTVLSAYE